MKLDKIPINQMEEVDLDEMAMCRLLGGGTPGCCQCGCHYSSSTSSNSSANNAQGYTSDPGAQTCNCTQCSGCGNQQSNPALCYVIPISPQTNSSLCGVHDPWVQESVC